MGPPVPGDLVSPRYDCSVFSGPPRGLTFDVVEVIAERVGYRDVALVLWVGENRAMDPITGLTQVNGYVMVLRRGAVGYAWSDPWVTL